MAARMENQAVNALTCTAENNPCQPHPKLYSPPPQDPLKQAAIANGSLKINLRRFRRDVSGSAKVSAVNCLLDACEAIARSLEWLNGKADAKHDDFLALEQLATDVAAAPEANGVSQ